MEKFVIIDTDAGTDDAWGIFLALAAQRDSVTPRFNIVAITTTCGNTNVDNVANNVTRVLDTVNDTTTPIHRGMDSYLVYPFKIFEDPPYNGEDGFGDADLPLIPTRVEAEHSVPAIIQLAQAYQGQLTMICLGPSTNLAMAVKTQPMLKSWLKEIFILGGNIEGVGNVNGISTSAEFNFFCDPEAAQVVLSSFEGCPIYNIPWENMLKFASPLDFRMETLGSINTPVMDLLNKIEAKNLSQLKDTWLAPDAMLIACVIDQNVLKETVKYRCDVELNGTLTRGMMVLDRNEKSVLPKNVNIIMEIDQTLYENMLIWAAGGTRP